MFIGHYALGLASRRRNQLPSLAMLFIAVQLLDLLWPLFVLTGIESFTIEPGDTAVTPLHFTHYPISHSLLMAVVWGCLLSVLYFLFTRNRKGALLLIPMVISHWVLDYVTHRPDLPLTPFSETTVGLGLWNHKAATIAVEVSFFVIGAYTYFKKITPLRNVAYWSLMLVLIAIYFLNILGPPPPSVEAVAWSANLMWIFVLWAWWIERPLNNTG